MSTVEELRRLLEEERAGRQEERAGRLNAERKQAEAERKQAEAEREKDEAERKIRPTTLHEYLQACHELVLSGIVYSVEGYLTSKTPATDPTRKHCPRLLTEWTGFEDARQEAWEMVNDIIPESRGLFESLNSLQTIGARLHGTPVFGEPSLAFTQSNSVEHPVRIILSRLTDLARRKHGLPVFDQIVFETSATSLRDKTDGAAPVDTVERDKKPRTDQICVSRRAGEQRNIAYVIEYKAPHKLHTQHLEEGLRQMDIIEEVVNKPIIPTEDPARFKHYAELLATAAVTQTYHYMIEAGLEYGYIANGDDFVFLWIDWDDPTVLHYHLAHPSREVEAEGDPEAKIAKNAVSQVLAFSVLAVRSTQKRNDVRVAAALACQTYEVNFDRLLHKLSELEGQDEGYNTTGRPGRKHRRVPSDPDWTPRPIRKKTKRAATSSQDTKSGHEKRPRPRDGSPGPGTGAMRDGDAEETRGAGSTGGAAPSQAGSGSSGSGRGTASGSGSRTHTHTHTHSLADNTEDETEGHAKPKAYCTPLCLLSLVKGGFLDAKCPNALLHRGGRNATGRLRRHAVSFAQWTDLLRQELTQSLDKGVVVLGQEGACGALFQVSLLQYGYTFIAKGGTGRSIPKLQKEHAIYQRLEPLQGRNIPVCLGLVDLRELRQVYFYDFDVRIVYFLLLSYGGSPFRTPPAGAVKARIRSTMQSVVGEMHSLGVVHGDIALRNVLLGPNDVPVLIDFDKGRLLPVATTTTTTPPGLAAGSSNKRKRVHPEEEQDDAGMAKAVKNVAEVYAPLDAETRVRMHEDRVNAQFLM